MKRVPNGKRKAAISSIIGGLFVLAIMVLGLASVVYVSSLENNVHAAQNSVAQIDVARNQERLNVVNTLFGGTQTYTPSQSYVTGGSCVNTCGLTMVVGNGFRYGNTVWCSNAAVCGSSNYVRGTLEPGYAPFNVTSQTTTGTQQLVSDMNFSSGINGWAVYTTSSQVIGGYASTQGNSVPGSGVGAMYVGASFISGATVSSNETTRFYLNPTSTGTGTITQAAFSFAEFFSQNAFSSATLSSYTYNLYLIDETSGANYLMWTNTVTTANKADTQWNYNTGINNLVSGGRNGAGGPIASVLTHNGYYDIVLQTTIVFKSGTCGTTCTQFFGYFDDVGLAINYQSFVTDWNYRFVVGQTRTSVQSLSFSLTTSYNQTNVIQSVYLYDWVFNKYDLFSTTTASTGQSTVNLVINVTSVGQSSAQDFVSSSGLVILRVYSMRPSALSTGAIGNNMEIDVDSVNELSISLSFLSQNAFTLVLQNVGAQPIDIVALVIIDSNGHTYVNSTGALMYDGSFNTTLTFDQIIYPQQTLTTEVQYRWTSGLISICFLTSLGNAFSTSTVATS